MRLKVRFYKTLSGNEPVREWLNALGKPYKTIIGFDIRSLKKRRSRILSLRRGEKKRFSNMNNKKNPYTGSDFDQWLEEEDLKETAEAVAAKRVLVWQLEQFMNQNHYSKVMLSTLMHTSRAQLDRLLNPTSTSVTLKTLTRAAEVIGKKLEIRFS